MEDATWCNEYEARTFDEDKLLTHEELVSKVRQELAVHRTLKRAKKARWSAENEPPAQLKTNDIEQQARQ